MNRQDCTEVRERLPELLSGVLGAEGAEEVRAHLTECRECREEAEVLQTLLRARPEPPPGLEVRIRERLERELTAAPAPSRWGRKGRVVPLFGGRFPIPAAALPAAAVLILALGTGILLKRGPALVDQEPIQVVLAEEPLPEAYLWDDGVVAGAPLFEGLSDEELESLLAELEGEA